VELVRVQWIRYRHCSVGHNHVDGISLDIFRGYGGPVPVWKPQRGQSLPIAVLQLALGKCRDGLATIQIEDFFEQGKERSMPCRENVAVMGAVAGVAAPVIVVTVHAVPWYEWAPVNSYVTISVSRCWDCKP
jgi:hypothetical protein